MLHLVAAEGCPKGVAVLGRDLGHSTETLPSRLQHGGRQFQFRPADAGGLHLLQSPADVVLDAAQLDTSIVDDRIGAARITVSRLPHTAGIDDLKTAQVQMEGDVRVTDAHEVRFDRLQT